jgi:hypothetical protein
MTVFVYLKIKTNALIFIFLKTRKINCFTVLLCERRATFFIFVKKEKMPYLWLWIDRICFASLNGFLDRIYRILGLTRYVSLRSTRFTGFIVVKNFVKLRAKTL